jgi:hypothetical protein
MPHIFTRRRCVRTVRNRVVDTDATSIEVHAVELLDATCSILDGSHFYEAKSTGSIGLPLIIHDCDFFDTAEATELFVEVALLGANAEAKHTKHIGRIGGLNWGVGGTAGRGRRPAAVRAAVAVS